MSFNSRFIFYYTLTILLIQLLITVSDVNCVKFSEPSKLEVIRFLMDVKKIDVFRKIRDLPLLQLIGLVNDVVEPIVTFAEVVLLLEQLKEKPKNKHQHMEAPIHLTTKDQIMVFSGQNKLEVNHFKKGLKPTNGLPYTFNEPNVHSMPDIKESNNIYNELNTIESNDIMDEFSDPSLVSSRVRQSPKGLIPNENHFQFNYESSKPTQQLNLVRDLPKNFALTYGNSEKSGTFRTIKHQKSYRIHSKPSIKV